MSNRTLLVISGLVALVAAGAWYWFLSGRSLGTQDSWSSVLGAVVALISSILSLGIAAVSLRQTRREPPATTDRSVRIGKGVRGAVVTGDHNKVRTRAEDRP